MTFASFSQQKSDIPDAVRRLLCFMKYRIIMDCDLAEHGWIMMTSSNGNFFRVTGPLCGEFTGPRWTPLTEASDAELWCFLLSAPE